MDASCAHDQRATPQCSGLIADLVERDLQLVQLREKLRQIRLGRLGRGLGFLQHDAEAGGRAERDSGDSVHPAFGVVFKAGSITLGTLGELVLVEHWLGDGGLTGVCESKV